jgi:hypothetical protein
MAKKHDLIPGPDVDFNAFFKHYVQYVTVKCTGQSPEWTHIPSARNP